MKKTGFVLAIMVWMQVSFAQTVSQQVSAAFHQFLKDPQLKAAIASFYVVDVKTGKVLFEKNAETGLAPASTLKLVSSAAAYELLGKNFRYKTAFGYSHKDSAIYIFPSGDPTLGSWRWEQTNEKNTLARMTTAFRKNIKSVAKIVFQNGGWNTETIPDGWIWQDIGNYYGAGARGFNWRENQFDLVLKSGKNAGDKVEIIKTDPKLSSGLRSMAIAAAKGSGDNAYIYFPLDGSAGVLRGTIPAGEDAFTISGAVVAVENEFGARLMNELKPATKTNLSTTLVVNDSDKEGITMMHTETSPPLDSIIYWLNKKSINLYAEALVKSIAFKQKGLGETGKGVESIKAFWKNKGIDPVELNMADGSGLSPLNRVTTKAQVQVLLYAKQRPWYEGFYYSLPMFNGMKMKSGSISDVKGFTGYHTSGKGVEYAFSFLVNNYNGSSATLAQKMYKVLDELK